MTGQDRFRLGIIGFGIGKIYAASFLNVKTYYPRLPAVELVGIATSSEASARAAVEHFGFPFATTDYRELLQRDDIDGLVIAPPNYLHYPMLLDALQTYKAIYIDKPLTNTLEEAREVVRLARERGRNAQMIFEMRFNPALQYARELIQSGRLGQLYTFRARYYRSSYTDPNKSLRWKASAEKSGTGVLGDLGAHVIDLVSWLVGQPEEVCAQLRTFIPQRPQGPVETDDHFILQANLPGGVFGTIEAGRLITGAQNGIQVEVYGSEGSLRWDLEDPNHLYLADRRMPEAERGWLKIPTMQRYPDAALPGGDVPAGMVRFHIASAAAFIRSTVEGQPYEPDLIQGLRVQEVIDAACRSAAEKAWARVG